MHQYKYTQMPETSPDCPTEHTFQAVCNAMFNPGKRIYVNNEFDTPKELNLAAAASCEILLDNRTLFWTDLFWNSATITWLQFHSGCTLVSEPCMATCALITRPTQMPPLNHFRIGDNKSPANAATLIIQVDDIYINQGKKLAGPGIKKPVKLSPKGMPHDFWQQWQAQSSQYPLGVDIFFACEDALVALPKTTLISN
jgi:alpha-D-ribose 1-methylphosphonate 5-triphosphate synthase subunit PhnH